MTMNKDLFYAILAMDSYNRGYGLRIAGLSDTGNIGNASIQQISDSRANSASVNAGFFASSYMWNGETVISYRGTDSLLSDAWYGYGLALGTYDKATQANLAVDFFKAVTGREVNDAATPANVTTVVARSGSQDATGEAL
jgi:hypothetical protein